MNENNLRGPEVDLQRRLIPDDKGSSSDSESGGNIFKSLKSSNLKRPMFIMSANKELEVFRKKDVPGPRCVCLAYSPFLRCGCQDRSLRSAKKKYENSKYY